MTGLSADNKIVNGLWISPDGAPLSNLERLCIYSFCANGHDFHLWTYGDLPNVPQDTAPGKVEVRDGNEILPKRKISLAPRRLPNFSDWFRWELLRKIGGWYVDMDSVCVRKLAFADEVVFGKSRDTLFNSAFLKFPKSHYIAEAMADACANPGKIVPWDNAERRRKKILRYFKFWRNAHKKQAVGESGGPEGFTFAANHFGVFKDALPYWYMEFAGHGYASTLFNNDWYDLGILEPLLQKINVIHFAHSSLGYRGIDKNGDFPPNSPFEVMKRRYLPECKNKGGA